MPGVASFRQVGAPLAAALTGLLALVVFLRTLAPTITVQHSGADSGDLVTAAINLGVPHPSGYPLYTLLAHLFAALPWGEPARNVGAISALAGALAASAVFWAAYRLLAEGAPDGPILASSWAAAGLFAFGQLLWSQATIAEVYSLEALLVSALLCVALTMRAERRPYSLAFLFGLGLAHHLTIVLLLPALWPYLFSIARWLTARRAALVGACLLLGPLAYAYIPLRAVAHPVPNWGQADSLQGFFWLITGAAYRRYLAGPVPAHLLQRLSAWAGIWLRDLGLPGLILATLGLWHMLERDRRFAWFGLTYLALLSGYAILYVTADSYIYLLAAAPVIALWVAQGAMVALQALQGRASPRRLGAPARGVALVALAGLPLVSLVGRWQAMDLSVDRSAYVYAQDVLEAARPHAIVISNGDDQTFPLWYLRYGLRVRPDVTVVDRNLLALDWYRRDLAAREPELAAVGAARGPDEAALLLAGAHGRPLQLAYSDGRLLELASWTQEGPLLTLEP